VKAELNVKATVAMLITSVFAVGIAAPVLASEAPLWSRFHNASLFSRSEKIYDKLDLVAGSIVYVNDKKDEGYRPEKMVSLNAKLSQKVYDYPKNTSALLIFEDMQAELTRGQFETLYQCEGAACGDLDGWRLYLSPFIAGDTKSQRYLLAKHMGRDGIEWYVQFYAIDIGGKPRAVMSVIEHGKRPAMGLALNKEVMRIDNARSVATLDMLQIKFGPGSAILTPQSQSVIQAIAAKIQQQKIAKVEMVGYTDNQGDMASNMALSQARAQAVVDALKAQAGMEQVQMFAQGQGPNAPNAENTTADGRARNRRVDVRLQAAENVQASADSSTAR